MPRRRKAFTAKRLAVALGAASGSMLVGSLIATHTVSAINPFYRYAIPAGWREPVLAPPEPSQPPPITYTPIGWGPDVLAGPPSAELPPEPELDAYDDTALLAEIGDPPPLPLEAEPEPTRTPAVIRIDAPAPPTVIQVETEPVAAAPAPPELTQPTALD